MTTICRALRNPMLWTILVVAVALTSRTLAAIIFLLAWGSLMLAFAWSYRRTWLRTREVRVWRYNLHRRWGAMAVVGVLGALGAFAVLVAVTEAVRKVSSA